MGIWFSEFFKEIFWKQIILGNMVAACADDRLARTIFQNGAKRLLKNVGSYCSMLTPTSGLLKKVSTAETSHIYISK